MKRALLLGVILWSGLAEARPRAPEPELRPGRVPRARDSVLQLSGGVPLATVEALARRQIPANQRWRAKPYTHPINGGAGTVDGISIGYDIVSGVASVRAGNRGEIVTVIPVTYSIWARYQPVSGGPSFDASCLRRAAQLVLTTRLAIHRSKLSPKTRASVAAGSRCVITRLNIDVTDLLTILVGSQLSRVTDEIDREVAGSLEVGGAAAIAWRRLLEPQKVDGGWLDLGPASMQVPPIAVDGDRVTATLQVIAKSSLSFGGDKPERRATPAPEVDSHASPPQLSVVVGVSVSDDALDRWATRAARSIKLPRRITGVTVRPRGRQVAVGVELASVGRVWMTGELGADPSTGAVSISALRLTGPSRAMLAGGPVRPAALVAAAGKALATIGVDALADLRVRAQDALTSSLSSAVPLLSGAAAIERVSLASVVARSGERRFYFRAEGTSVGGSRCSIRRRGKIDTRDLPCTRAAVRPHCRGDRRCEYSTDGRTWLPVW